MTAVQIRDLMGRMGWAGPTAMSRALGVSPATVYRWTTGRTAPRGVRLAKLRVVQEAAQRLDAIDAIVSAKA